MKKKISDTSPALPVPGETRTVPLHQQIASQAYTLWKNYGRPAGRDETIWMEAERQVLGADRNVDLQGGGALAAGSLGSALSAGVPADDEEDDPLSPSHWYQ